MSQRFLLECSHPFLVAASIAFARPAPQESNPSHLEDAAWTGSAYVGVSTDAVWTSTDGRAWTSVHASPEHALALVAGSAREFAAAGDGVLLLGTQTDGEWKVVEHAVPDAAFSAIGAEGSVFVALERVGRAHVARAGAWTTATIDADAELRSVAFGDGTWLASGERASEGALYVARDPAGAWTRVATPSAAGGLHAAVYALGRFYVAGSEGHVLVSRDAKTWEDSAALESWAGVPTSRAFGTRDAIAYLADGLYVAGADGTWSVHFATEELPWSTPVVRDGVLQVRIEDDSSRFVPLTEILEREKALEAEAAARERATLPADFAAVVHAPERLTRFDGADVHDLAASDGVLFAAAENGLWSSTDGRAWTRFGGITTPVTRVAATAGRVAVGGRDGVRIARIADGAFTAVESARFAVRELRARSGTFAASGEGVELAAELGGEWQRIPAEGAQRVRGLDVDAEGVIHVAVDTAKGARTACIVDGAVELVWTPMRGGAIQRAACGEYGFLACVDPATGATFAELEGANRRERVDVLGAVTDLVSAPGGFVYATAAGRVVHADEERTLELHALDGIELDAVVASPDAVVAAGRGGALLLLPGPYDAATTGRPVEVQTLDPLPADWKLPPETRARIVDESTTNRIQRIRMGPEGPVALLEGKELRAWDADGGWSGRIVDVDGLGALADAAFDGANWALVGERSIVEHRPDHAAGAYSYYAHTQPLRRIVRGASTWLALGTANEIAESANLGALNPLAYDADVEFTDAAFGAGVWVVVGARKAADGSSRAAVFAGVSGTSPQAVALPPTAGALAAVAFDGERFVAVGERGTIATSTDGFLWSVRELDGRPRLVQVTRGPKQVVAAAEDGTLLASSDLATWRALPNDAQFPLRTIVGDARSVWAFGEHVVLAWSAPPAEWNAGALRRTREVRADDDVARVALLTRANAASSAMLGDAVWDGGRFVVPSAEGVLASVDGRTFRSVAARAMTYPRASYALGRVWIRAEEELLSLAGGSDALRSVHRTRDGSAITDFAADGTKLVLVTRAGHIELSTDAGTTWRDVGPVGVLHFGAVAHGDGRWIAIGSGLQDEGVVASSLDGVEWTLAPLPGHEGGFHELVHGAGRFVAASVDGSPVVASSRDGATWTPTEVDGAEWGHVAFHDGRFALVNAEHVLLSSDGERWLDANLAPRVDARAVSVELGELWATGALRDDANLARIPFPSADTFASSRPVATRPHEGFAGRWAAWDAAMCEAKDSTERRKLTRDLLRAWRDTHPSSTTEDALAFVDGLFERTTGYETNDEIVFDAVSDLGDLSDAVMHAALAKLPGDVAGLVRQIAGDVSAEFEAKQAGRTPPAHGPRVQARSTPVQPARSAAAIDVHAWRLRAARGDRAAALDLSYVYSVGMGVPVDPSARGYWAKRAGIDERSVDSGTPEAVTAYWRLRAEQGSTFGQWLYGQRLAEGIGTKADPKAGFDWCLRSEQGGNLRGKLAHALALRSGAGVACDAELSLRLLRECDAAGLGAATAEIGWAYEAGAGVRRDLREARRLYQKAADARSAWAMRRLGDYAYAGFGEAKDEARAKECWTKAVQYGDESARDRLARVKDGKPVELELALFVPSVRRRPDFDVAARKARAEAGEAAACYDLAFATWSGLGIDPDLAEGRKWLKRAEENGWKASGDEATAEERAAAWVRGAEQGSCVALYEAGRCYVYGIGHAVELEKGLAFLRRSAELGHYGAMAELALALEEGRGSTTKDDEQALAWMRRAAEGGNAFAQMRLGFRQEHGNGVPQDLAAARASYLAASEGGNENGMLNASALLALGLGGPVDLVGAANEALAAGGLARTATTPEGAYAVLSERRLFGDADVLGALAVVTRRGFGCNVNPEEAWALQRAAKFAQTTIYPDEWFDHPSMDWPKARRRAAELVADVCEHAVASPLADTSRQEAALAFVRRSRTFEASADDARSKVALALRALESGADATSALAALGSTEEPLRVRGLDALWKQAPGGRPADPRAWLARIGGSEATPEDALSAVLGNGDGSTDEALRTRRALLVAEFTYGIGRARSRVDALAWALLGVEHDDALLALRFLASLASPDDLEAAAARSMGLAAEALRDGAAAAGPFDPRPKRYAQLLQDAALAGDLASMHVLAQALEEGGPGIVADPLDAFLVRSRLADLGDVESQFRVARTMLDDPSFGGATEDGMALLERAAAAGHAGAKALLETKRKSGKR